MKKISADYIFPGNDAPIKNGIVVVGLDGGVLDVLNPEKEAINWDEVELYEGIICPGFVNTHCHLELSYLKEKLPEKKQLPDFVKEIISIRDNFTAQERLDAIIIAEQEMINNGIVAVGDITNGNSTFKIKEKSKIRYHTFLEVFSLNPKVVDEVMDRAITLKQEYHNQNRVSITAHAPYSMSQRLKELVNKMEENIFTIHNQESKSENDLFLTKSGKLYEQLASISEDIKNWIPTGKNSLPSYLSNFNANKKTLLVHNTYTSSEDIDYAKNYSNKIYWCFCPNANEYIEGVQPNYDLFLNEKCTIGTDSLASNWSLSILDELKTISKKNTTISLETLLKWATFNGADFLGFDELGSIEKGKYPGLNLISGTIDLKLTTKSSVKKIL